MSAFEIILEFVNEKVWLAVFIVLLIARVCPRKRFFVRKFVAGTIGLLVLGFIPRLLYERFPESALLGFWQYSELMFWAIILALYAGLIFQCNWNLKIFSALAGLCTLEIMFGIWAFIVAVEPSARVAWIEFLVHCVVGTILAIALYYVLAIKITLRSLQVLERGSLVPLLIVYLLSMLLVYNSTNVVVFFSFFFDVTRDALIKTGALVEEMRLENVRYESIFANMLGNAMVLFALRNMLRYSEADLEKELLEQIREQDRKQYSRFRDNVDYINTKSHDLKHYLELLQRNEKLPEKELHQVSESLLHLDSETDSGNETLDMILTDRRIACESRGIELIFQTDGTRLEQLDVIDTYTVFCNILDNAVEYVKDLPEGERQIRLGIRTIHSMVFIHQENPLNEDLDMKDGLPITTQADPSLHGFGLKSVQDTVKKCDGELVIRAESGRFELDICFSQEV